MDPLSPEYPWYTPYQFAGNRVIDKIELEGLEPTGFDIRFDRRVSQLANGQISEKEYWGQLQAEGIGGLLAGTLIIDFYLAKGKLTKRFLTNMGGQAAIHSGITLWNGNFSWEEVGNRLDYADGVMAMTNGGIMEQVILPALVDGNNKGEITYWGGGKSTSHTFIDMGVNLLFFGLGKGLDVRVAYHQKAYKAKNKQYLDSKRSAFYFNDFKFKHKEFYLHHRTSNLYRQMQSHEMALFNYELLNPLTNLTLNWGPDFTSNPIKENTLSKPATEKIYTYTYDGEPIVVPSGVGRQNNMMSKFGKDHQQFLNWIAPIDDEYFTDH